MNILLNKLSRKKQYLYSLAAILFTSSICYILSDFIGYRVVAFILLLSVSLLAVLFDILPVLLAAALSAFIWDFFFIPPRFTLHAATTEDAILLVMYFLIAMINGVLTYKLRQVEKLSRLKEERANSVKLYNTILNSLSHELRTPIAAIIGATDNLQQNKNLTKQNQEQLVEEISKASLRLNQQVENLLNISRLESGHIKPKNDWSDIVELIYEVVKRVEENNPGRKLNVNVDQHMPFCKIDRGMLDQVIYNLANNAAVHTPPDTVINVLANCYTDLLEIIIEDNGKGFKDVDTKDVFDKFSREKILTNSGSGLGLSIVKGFTEALGGTVMLEKAKKNGAKFIISIPVKTDSFNIVVNE